MQTELDLQYNNYNDLIWWFSDGMGWIITEVNKMDLFDFYKGLEYLENKIKKQNNALKGGKDL